MNNTTSGKTGFRLQTSLTLQIFVFTFIGFFATNLVNVLGVVVDGVVVGHTMGALDISASSLMAPLTFAISMFSGLISNGGQIVCMDRLSHGKVEEAKKIFSMALTICVFVSVIFSTSFILFSHLAIGVLGIDEQNPAYETSRLYMIGIMIGVPGQMLWNLITQGLNIEGARKHVLTATILMTVSNIILDLAVVYCLHGGMFHMGLTTSISYYVSLTYLLLYYRKSDVLLKPSLVKPSIRTGADIFYKGLPRAVNKFTSSVKSRFINGMLGISLTSVGYAAYHMQNQINYVLNAFIFGIAGTMSVMCNIFYAEEDKKHIRKTMLLTTVAVGMVLLILGLGISNNTFCKGVIRFYLGENEEVFPVARIALGAYMIGLLGQAVSAQLANYFQTTKRIMAASAIYILDDVVLVYFMVNSIVGYAEAKGYTDSVLLNAVFSGVAFAQWMMVLLLPLFILIVNRRFGIGWEWWLMLPKNFGIKAEDEVTAEPQSVEDAVDFSKRVYDLCIGKGVARRKAYIVSLASEELIKNTITYGFQSGKNCRMETRLVCKGDEVILRIRDNCSRFNPKVYYETVYEQQDKTSSMGIRMIMEMTREFSYTTALKMNNIMVKV